MASQESDGSNRYALQVLKPFLVRCVGVSCVTFGLHALRWGEAAALVVEVTVRLDSHTVPGPGLQVRQSHQVGAAAHRLDSGGLKDT